MEIRTPLFLSLCLIAAMAAMSVWGFAVLPDTAIATHFGADGLADGFMTKPKALLAGPLLGVAITALFAVLPRLTRRKEGLIQSAAAYVTSWLGILTAIFVAHCVVLFHARGVKMDIAGSGVLLPSLLMIMIGNVLGKTRPNPYVGVRTPWTRKSALSWDKTNRLAGRLLVASGLLGLAALAMFGALTAHAAFLSGVLATAVICIALSRHYWEKDPHREP